jgi:hypothetical protein
VYQYRKEKQQQLCIFFHHCLEPPAVMTTTPPLGVVGDLWLLLDLEFDIPVTQGSFLPYMLFGMQVVALLACYLIKLLEWSWFDGLHYWVVAASVC